MIQLLVFEGLESTAEILKKNINSNKLEGVVLINKAVGGKEGTIQMYGDGRAASIEQGMNKEHKTINSSFDPGGIKVEVDLLSNYINKNKRIDFLKMDIEGAESDVIRDVSNTGVIEYIDKIVLEFHKFSYEKNSLASIVQELENFEYNVFFFDGINTESAGAAVAGQYDFIASNRDIPAHVNRFAHLVAAH